MTGTDPLRRASCVALAMAERARGAPVNYFDETAWYQHGVLAWLWVQAFGTGEVGLRLFSAVAGVATVPVVYAVGRTLASRRIGLVAAALAATSPYLVFYSQEARSYALFALLNLEFGNARGLDEIDQRLQLALAVADDAAGGELLERATRYGTIAELEQLIVRINRTPGVASTRTAIALSTKWENRPQPGLG